MANWGTPTQYSKIEYRVVFTCKYGYIYSNALVLGMFETKAEAQSYLNRYKNGEYSNTIKVNGQDVECRDLQGADFSVEAGYDVIMKYPK